MAIDIRRILRKKEVVFTFLLVSCPSIEAQKTPRYDHSQRIHAFRGTLGKSTPAEEEKSTESDVLRISHANMGRPPV
jgi:hypothetical protein